MIQNAKMFVILLNSLLDLSNTFIYYSVNDIITHFCVCAVARFSASDHLSTKSTFCVSLENGFSLKHVLKELVYKDHFLCFPWAVAVDRFDCTVWGQIHAYHV